VGRALRQKNVRGAQPVRQLVFTLIAELRTAAQAWDQVEAAVVSALDDHPDLAALDSLNVVTGKQTSSALRAWMVGWVHHARELESPMAARQRSRGDRINVQKAETVLEQLPPVLDRHLSLVRECDPAASSAEVMDRALKEAVMDLRFALNRQTFDYLRWRVDRVREAVAATRAKHQGAESQRA
jgi:hypothetical protein